MKQESTIGQKDKEKAEDLPNQSSKEETEDMPNQPFMLNKHIKENQNPEGQIGQWKAYNAILYGENPQSIWIYPLKEH